MLPQAEWDQIRIRILFWLWRCQQKVSFFEKFFFLFLLSMGKFSSVFGWQVIKKSQNRRNQGFPKFFSLLPEGSGSADPYPSFNNIRILWFGYGTSDGTLDFPLYIFFLDILILKGLEIRCILYLLVAAREMENIYISRGPTFGDWILSLSAQRGRCRTSRLQDCRFQEYRLPSPPLF